MRGGDLFADFAIVAALVAAGTWLIWQMQLAAIERRKDGRWGVFGDVVELPPAAKSGGSRRKSAASGA